MPVRFVVSVDGDESPVVVDDARYIDVELQVDLKPAHARKAVFRPDRGLGTRVLMRFGARKAGIGVRYLVVHDLSRGVGDVLHYVTGREPLRATATVVGVVCDDRRRSVSQSAGGCANSGPVVVGAGEVDLGVLASRARLLFAAGPADSNAARTEIGQRRIQARLPDRTRVAVERQRVLLPAAAKRSIAKLHVIRRYGKKPAARLRYAGGGGETFTNRRLLLCCTSWRS